MRILISAYFFIIFCSCSNKPSTYLNIAESVNYIGMNQCAACHLDKYESFIQTGMGKSMRPALKQHSSSFLSHVLYDSILQLHYDPHWKKDTLFLHEYQIKADDTIHSLKKKIDYIIGSGHHTNSHIFENNGYLYQAPFTYYIQDSILDFPPGFENDKNSRFSRKMGIECIACHNAYPDFVLGSENKYEHIPLGIDCERCHGPGQLHVENIQKHNIIDTSKHIDYSIVNPSNLSPELQNDMCARCHLQGNAVLQDHKSFFDFKPGMYLREVMDVYLPRYEGHVDSFIMASHFDRMKLSSCYIKSDGGLSCLNCHNPHISVKQTDHTFFNQKCLECHANFDCDEELHEKQKNNNNCVQCHMRTSNTIDIPHVKITDHKISTHHSIDTTKIYNGNFLGLVCVNNDNPTYESIIQAYLQQYERFEPYQYYLDSAQYYLTKIDLETKRGIYTHIYYLFLKNDYDYIIKEVNRIGLDSLLNYYFITKDYSNQDAWSCYRIGEAFFQNDQFVEAEKFYQQSVKLAPYNLEFRNKYGVCLFNQEKLEFAIDEFKFIINEDNNFVSAYTNLGYLSLKLGKRKEALMYYNYALTLDPGHEKTLVNKAQLLLLDNNKKDAFICVDKLLLLNPDSEEAQILLNILNEI
tara:strand:+ start:12508 stop:14418 length:1911 start_codon:yes stop_codon:yes gene_type:complete